MVVIISITDICDTPVTYPDDLARIACMGIHDPERWLAVWVLLRCPSCRVRANYNGRGLCSCRRAYLLHSFAGRTVELPDHAFRGTPDPSGEFIAVYDDQIEEAGYWQPMAAGVYTVPDGRRRRVESTS
jgi:hypothetical protein